MDSRRDSRSTDPRNSVGSLAEAEKPKPPPQSCARKTRRGCLVCINILVMLVGLFFIGIGVAVKTQYSSALSFNTTLISAKSAENFQQFSEVAPLALIAFGAVITFFSITGVISGCCEYRPMIFIYIFFLGLVVIAQLGVGGYAISERSSVNEIGNDIVSSTWDSNASRALFKTACEQTLLPARVSNSSSCDVEKGATLKTCQNCISGILSDNLVYAGAFLLGIVLIEILALVLACFGLRKPKPPPALATELEEFKAKLGQLDSVRVV